MFGRFGGLTKLLEVYRSDPREQRILPVTQGISGDAAHLSALLTRAVTGQLGHPAVYLCRTANETDHRPRRHPQRPAAGWGKAEKTRLCTRW